MADPCAGVLGGKVDAYLLCRSMEKVVARYQKSKVWKAWSGTTIYKLYTKYQDLYG